MRNKVTQVDYFEDYTLLGIVSTLKDYSLAFFINKNLGINLEKYGDLVVEGSRGEYPWFHYKQGKKYPSCYLIGNHHPKQKLIPTLQTFDYFFLVKDAMDEEQIQESITGIRNIKNVMAVYEKDMNTVKDLDMVIEANELHEFEQVIMHSKAKTKS